MSYNDDPVLKLIGWATAAILAVCLVGLTVELVDEATEIKAGTIVDKAYYPDEHLWIPVWTPCGNGCSVMTVVYTYVPECYALYLREGEETGDVCVSKMEWEEADEGLRWG